MILRDYQQDAVNSAIAELRQSVSPILLEMATGAGKSLVVAALARWFNEVSGGKRVLCLAPQKELILQNVAKYKATGEPCSIFSASAGVKSTRHPCIFGTPGTVSRSISRFLKDFCAVVLDEAHGLTPTVLAIIEAMREANPNLRVVGMTATPFRTGTGYIYRVGPDGKANGDDTARDPYFAKLVYRIGARELIERGYLTPPVVGAIHAESYDTSGLVLKANGKFDDAAIDQAFVGHGRKTSAIVGDVLAQSRGAKGVVFFAATVQHAAEIMASLPPQLSAMVTGETQNRATILKRFERQQIKYLCNVSVLTTGWDCAHVDVIAVLRRTESVGLFQQIIGRGLRLSPGKERVLILDYAENHLEHTPSGDLFAPEIRANKKGEKGGPINAVCPECSFTNEFSLNPDCADYQIDEGGFCLDVWGQRVETDFGPMAAHCGRRCNGLMKAGREYVRCSFRYAGKPCPACEEPNDTAARYCYSCKAEIVDVAAKLAGDFRAMKRDSTLPQTDKILEFKQRESISQKGNRTIRADWHTEWRTFSTWHLPEATHPRAKADWEKFDAATREGTPETISYIKDRETAFFRIISFNQEPDHAP